MMLPNGWKKGKLGDILTAVDYGTAAKSDAIGKYPVLRMGNLENGYLVWDDLVYSSSEDEYAKYELEKGDILFNRTNSRDKVGKTSIYRGERPSIFAGYLIRLKVNNECDPYYVNYCMNSKRFAEFCKSVRTDAIGQSNINAQVLQTYDFSLPPLEEQKKIAATLSVWDSAIEKMEKLIEAKESGHAVLMNEMLKNSKTWDCTCLSDIATIKKGKQLNAVDMISDGAYYVMNGGIAPSGNTDDWNTAENTISISEGGNSCGFVAFNKEKFWAGGHCYTLIDLNENISVRFLFHYLKNMEKEIMAMRVGSGLPNIQKDSISDIKVFYPSKKGQERISGVLDDSLSEIALLKQQLENYKKQKQGLMQKLLTGQWRVK